jgi:hypothetical protein
MAMKTGQVLRKMPASKRHLLSIFSFKRFVGGQTAAVLSYQILSVAVGWQIYDLTRSAFTLGLVGLAQFLPQFLLTLVQLETPDEKRGRVSAVNFIFIGTSNQLGEFESGVTAALFGTVPAVVIGGCCTLIVVALWMRLFPGLLRREVLVQETS